MSPYLPTLQAEMRAAVFLAMEDQDRLEVMALLYASLKSCCNYTDHCLLFFSPPE